MADSWEIPVTLTESLREASERSAAAHQQLVRDRLIQHASDTYGYAATYDNAVVIAGYAAFFALWAGAASDIDRFARLVTVCIMGISLMLYITWQFMQMLTRQRFEHKRAAIFNHVNDPSRFNAEWVENENALGIASMRLMRFWPFFFLPSVVFGLLAGIILAYNALAAAFGWNQLTGYW